MSMHAGISVVDIDDPQPIRDHAQDIQNAAGQTSEAASNANSSWQALSGQYVDPVVGPTIHSAYNRPANEASELSSAGTMAHSALSTLADTYESLRKRRQALITDLDKLASDESKGDKDSKGKNESKRAELQQEASTLSSDKQNADALAIVALGGIPSPTGEPRSKDASAGYYGGIKQDAAEGAASAVAAAGKANPAAQSDVLQAVQNAAGYAGNEISKEFQSMPGKAANSWLGFKPPFGKEGANWALYGLSKAATGLQYGMDVAALTAFGRFRPNMKVPGRGNRYLRHDLFGRTTGTKKYARMSMSPKAMWNRAMFGFSKDTSPAGMKFLDRLDRWDPKKMFEAEAGKRPMLDKISKAGKYVGRVAKPLTFATAGLEEWQSSKDKPTEERVGQAGTKAFGVTAGSMVGGRVGTAVGAAVGSALIPIPGVGTAVGAIAGSAIGGWAGGEVGGWAADHLKEPAGKVTKAVTDGAKKVGGAIADKASDLGKAVKFW